MDHNWLVRQTTKYVALDIHQANTVASVRDSNRRVIARSILPTEASRITEFFAGMRGSIHVVTLAKAQTHTGALAIEECASDLNGPTAEEPGP